MNLNKISVFILLVLLMSACQAATFPDPQVSTITFTPTQVPATITASPTETLVPATPTISAFMKDGGVTLGVGASQLILYGLRAGEGVANTHVVDAGTFEEVKTQRGLATALNGGGPLLFVLTENQPFKSDNGETALANLSVGMTDEPDTYLMTMWTDDVTTRFPPEALGGQEKSFSYQWDADVELEGWLENGRIGLAQNNLPENQQQQGFNFILFHHAEETFILGFPPGADTGLPNMTGGLVVPPEFLEAQRYGVLALTGQVYSYMVTGFTKGTVSLALQNGFPIPVPILVVNIITMLK